MNEIFENIICSSVVDTTDEFQQSREQFKQGDLIFIYRNSDEKGVDNDLLSVCIKKNNIFTVDPESDVDKLDPYIVEIITTKYSVIYPHVPRTYLEVELYDILKDSKVPSDVLITYKQIIEDLK